MTIRPFLILACTNESSPENSNGGWCRHQPPLSLVVLPRLGQAGGRTWAGRDRRQSRSFAKSPLSGSASASLSLPRPCPFGSFARRFRSASKHPRNRRGSFRCARFPVGSVARARPWLPSLCQLPVPQAFAPAGRLVPVSGSGGGPPFPSPSGPHLGPEPVPLPPDPCTGLSPSAGSPRRPSRPCGRAGFAGSCIPSLESSGPPGA